MTMMQTFGKHELDYVNVLEDGKTSVAIMVRDKNHSDLLSYVTLFFDSKNEAAAFALEMLTKIINTMEGETK